MFIISEAGINANGSLSGAEEQILASKEAGADAVKFQVYDTDQLFDKNFQYYEDSKVGMFTKDQHKHLARVARLAGIEWFASCFHEWAVDLCEEIGVLRYKIASMTLNKCDWRIIKRIAETKKPVIMSTGGAAKHVVQKALDILKYNEVKLLYCVTKYPSRAEDFNMAEMFRLYNDFGLPVGLSSHCPSIYPSVKAVALGASVIEQHTTKSRGARGCDQSSSLEYPELAELVKIIRELEKVR